MFTTAYQVWGAVCSPRSSLSWYPSTAGGLSSCKFLFVSNNGSTRHQSALTRLSSLSKYLNSITCFWFVWERKKKEMREKEIPGKVNISENDGCLLFRFNFIWTIWVGYNRAARWLNMPSECGQCLGHALCSRHPKNYSWPSFSLPITAGCPYVTFSH